MQNIKVPFLVLVLLLLIPAAALAHAHLPRSQPVAGSTVHGSGQPLPQQGRRRGIWIQVSARRSSS